MQRGAVTLGRDAGRGRAHRAARRSASIGPSRVGIEAQTRSPKSATMPTKASTRACELARGDSVAGDVHVRERDRDERQHREQDRREAAVEKLFTPVDEAVVGREEDQADPDHERHSVRERRPSRAEQQAR